MKRTKLQKSLQTGTFIVICILYLMPIFIVLMNSFKTNASINTATFAFPNNLEFFHGLPPSLEIRAAALPN